VLAFLVPEPVPQVPSLVLVPEPVPQVPSLVLVPEPVPRLVLVFQPACSLL
jgi:hypothetical protein